MIKKIGGALCVLFLLCAVAWAEDAPPVSRIDGFLNKMKESMDKNDDTATDFWMARFIGEIVGKQNTERTLEDLQPYLGHHRAGNASQELTGGYVPSFNDWFVEQSQAQFGLDDVRVYNNTFELVNGGSETVDKVQYFAAFFAVPYIEGWTIEGKPSPQLIVLGSKENKPSILSGKLVVGDTVTYFHTVPFDASGPIQNVWKPEFEDLDDDGLPEFFIRYNYTNDDGVHQELAVFRFQNNEPILLKRFTGHYGGIARRLGNKQVEVGDSIKYGDQMTFETWEYQGGDFVSVGSKTGEHILKSESWKDYY